MDDISRHRARLRPALRAGALALAAWAVAQAALADPVTFAQSGPWTILYSEAVERECYMERRTETGTVFRIGLYGDRDRGFFSAMNESWVHIDAETEAELYFDFGDDLFSGLATGFIEGEFHGGYAYFNNPEFIRAIAAKTTLSVDGNRRVPVHVDLSGTSRALAEVRRCLKMRAGQ